MNSLEIRPIEDLRQFIELFNENVRTLDADEATAKVNSLIKYYSYGSKDPERPANPLEHLERQWIDALDKGEIDYSVYSDDDYYVEAYACWMVYTRNVMKGLSKHLHIFSDVKRILDLGNGIGRTTVGWKSLYPDAEVIATNFKDCEQWKISQALQKTCDFRLEENSLNLGEIDILFACEYFEHIEYPLEHLAEVIEANNPRYMIIANSFGTVGIGHFKEYKDSNFFVGTDIIDWKKISRRFNQLMRDKGYVKMEKQFFNMTPYMWERK